MNACVERPGQTAGSLSTPPTGRDSSNPCGRGTSEYYYQAECDCHEPSRSNSVRQAANLVDPHTFESTEL
eukprot:scaffold499093_cov38-Prasinocladus_malaysianus.AAC.1